VTPPIEATLAARLDASNITLMAEAKAYTIFVRDNCIALVHRNGAAFSSIGSSGIMTENGLAYLVWREDRPVLVGKGIELPADDARVAGIRQFSLDLKAALGLE